MGRPLVLLQRAGQRFSGRAFAPLQRLTEVMARVDHLRLATWRLESGETGQPEVDPERLYATVAPLFADCGPDFCTYEDDLNCQQSCAGCP